MQTEGTYGAAPFTWHLDTHAPLDPNKIGFQRHLSTDDCLLLIYNDVIANAVSGFTPLVLVATDNKNAFDYLRDTSLSEGVRGRTLKLIIAFLSGRTSYRVRDGNTLSRNRTNNVGVPQGSVVSPMQFKLALQLLPR